MSGEASADIFGKCKFDTSTLSFAGDEQTQASCLLRKVKILGNVEPANITLPQHLAALVGKDLSFGVPALRAYIGAKGLVERDFGGSLDDPLSRGNNNDPAAAFARYFVIHDTSSPNYKNAPFPADIDTNDRVNDLQQYAGSNAVAHIFLNRRGEILVGHRFSVPWRATKLETKKVGKPSKGLFLHIETIQPRRAHPSQPDGNAPDPGFTAVQYERLALLYLAASVRAGKGLIPAFHAAVDEGLEGGHDDPQKFDLAAFDTAIGGILTDIGAGQ
ncbi:MAG: hypothetical protein KF723_04245 [Rhizobiaceae bacterium]|nr:hypothetical protein [Rhizobiaceae bacterium]